MIISKKVPHGTFAFVGNELDRTASCIACNVYSCPACKDWLRNMDDREDNEFLQHVWPKNLGRVADFLYAKLPQDALDYSSCGCGTDGLIPSVANRLTTDKRSDELALCGIFDNQIHRSRSDYSNRSKASSRKKRQKFWLADARVARQHSIDSYQAPSWQECCGGVNFL